MGNPYVRIVCARAGSGPRILVVDSSADAADSLAMLLHLWGYDVRACYNGVTALETAPGFLPQAVLFDLWLPGMDGFALVQEFRSQGWARDTVFMVLTASGELVHRRRARELDLDRYFLLKPVEPRNLKALLRRVISLKNLPEEPWPPAPGVARPPAPN